MIIEPLPILDASCDSSCPACNQPIAGWVIEDKFSCPVCSEKLTSNHKPAIKKGIASGIFFYLLFLGAFNSFTFSSEVTLIIYLLNAIIPYLVGVSVFKTLFKLKSSIKK